MPQLLVPAARHLTIPVTTVDLPLISGRVLVKGFTLRETTGTAAAAAQFLDGTAEGGDPFIECSLGINESVRDWFTEAGILIQSGVFLDVDSGSVQGSVWVIPETIIGKVAFAGLIADVPNVVAESLLSIAP